MRPPKDPVPKASRVTFTPDLPSVTQSVALRWAARAADALLNPPSMVAATLVFRKSRLVGPGILHPLSANLSQGGEVQLHETDQSSFKERCRVLGLLDSIIILASLLLVVG